MPSTERSVLRNVLNNLADDGKIIKDGKFYYATPDDETLLSGEITLGENDLLMVRYNDRKNKPQTIGLRLRKEQKIAIGDKVEFRISRKSKSKKEFARIEKVISKDYVTVTGTFETKRRYGVVYPDSKFVRDDIKISGNHFNGAVHGDKVLCEIFNIDDIGTGFIDLEGRIKKVLGKAGDFDTELDAVIHKYGFEEKFPADVLSESRKMYDIHAKEPYSPLTDKKRRDIRNLVCFTIDPEDAKDFDDAVSVEKLKNGNFLLGVHIADVSYFVNENSPADTEALKRGTSVYLADRVVPMLPEVLSNDLCSLKPNVDRFTFSIFIELDKKFTVVKYEITKSIINSKRRFSYEEVQKIIEIKKGDFCKEILIMHRIAENLTKIRMKEGSIDFESKEVKFILDKKRKISEIKIKERLDSMRMIEEFMLLANRCVTEFVTDACDKIKSDLPFVYRVHDYPDVEKLRDLSEFIVQFGYSINLKDKDSIKRLLENVKGKPEEYVINDLLIRSMAKAVYTPENIGHYGLGFEEYTHFTSPIRRYPDLIVHRLLKMYVDIFGKKSGKFDYDSLNRKIGRYSDVLPDLCKHCSVQEMNAVSAERESVKVLQVQFVKNKIGDEFEGIISGIVKFGMYVEIMEYLIEGMVRFRDIEDDYYEYNERMHCAVGVRKGKTFRAGDRVKVRLVNVSLETKRIDFFLI